MVTPFVANVRAALLATATEDAAKCCQIAGGPASGVTPQDNRASDHAENIKEFLGKYGQIMCQFTPLRIPRTSQNILTGTVSMFEVQEPHSIIAVGSLFLVLSLVYERTRLAVTGVGVSTR
jgi:hypothetical protein